MRERIRPLARPLLVGFSVCAFVEAVAFSNYADSKASAIVNPDFPDLTTESIKAAYIVKGQLSKEYQRIGISNNGWAQTRASLGRVKEILVSEDLDKALNTLERGQEREDLIRTVSRRIFPDWLNSSLVLGAAIGFATFMHHLALSRRTE